MNYIPQCVSRSFFSFREQREQIPNEVRLRRGGQENREVVMKGLEKDLDETSRSTR